MDISDAIAIVFGLSGAVLGFLGWRKAGEANRLSSESNTIAWSSKAIAEDSNRIAVEANEISREANTVAKEDVEYRRRREHEANSAALEIPDEGAIWTYNQNGRVARMGVHLLNRGTSEARDIVMTASADGHFLGVERGNIHRLTRDDIHDVRLLFQIPIDDSWANPESRVIRLQFNFFDGTGPREDSYCFQLSGTVPQDWKSLKIPCP